MTILLQQVLAALSSRGDLTVALSGGVDSVTLAVFAHRQLGARVRWVHATSAAVPGDALDRIAALRAQEGARLDVVDAGELRREEYLSNPSNRCFYCKSSLYESLHRWSDDIVCSGTNVDDLEDFRPGLLAAKNAQVVHPFVDARMRKADVRALALALGLPDIAEMPSSPCLSSRVETGIRIEPQILQMIDDVERRLRAGGLRTVRCRVRSRGVVIEHDDGVVDAALHTDIATVVAVHGFAAPSYAPYTRGGAFLRVLS
jgi:pyridinium-3,5-biscarboxylic acid mononucleotide sulfurtransferase